MGNTLILVAKQYIYTSVSIFGKYIVIYIMYIIDSISGISFG